MEVFFTKSMENFNRGLTYFDQFIMTVLLYIPFRYFTLNCKRNAAVGQTYINQFVSNYEMSHLVRKPTMWFTDRSDTNQAVWSQKQARSLKFRI